MAGKQALDSIERVGDLEVAQDLRFQRRAWTAQRIGWAWMALVVVAAVVGVFGHGLGSERSTTSRDGTLKVEYSWVARHRAPDTLRLTLAPGAVQGDEARLAFSSDTLDGMTVETVYPEPESVETGADQTVYVFKLTDEATLTTIVFNVMFEDVGRRRGAVTLDGHQPAEFSQFVMP